MKISVIVTNWNGLKLLKKHFLDVIKTSSIANEIIFADDCSEDESVSYIKSLQADFPKIKIITQKENVGFGQNSNHAVHQAIGDLVVLLNSDISPHQNYIENSLKHFADKQVFGVGFAENEHENYGQIYWAGGYVQIKPGISKKTHISGWLSGGSSIIRKQYFEQLGGFDGIYAPFYCEDLDLGLRAWKSGFQCLWEPTSVVDHVHEATMSKFPRRLLDYVKERNRLLTVWRNISDKKLLTENRLALIGRILTGPNYIKIIRAASLQMSKYPKPIHLNKLSDQEIFYLFK
jgi:GT2 family glycosyltransferase